MTANPMPSSSEKPLTTSDRLALFLAGAMQQAESIALRHPSDSKIVTRDRLMTSRIPGMVEELEALLESGLRESRAVSPDSEKRDADYANRNIRTMELANAVAVHLGLNPADEIPFEELTRRLHDLPPVDGFGSHKADLAELRVLQKKVQEGKSLSPSPADTDTRDAERMDWLAELAERAARCSEGDAHGCSILSVASGDEDYEFDFWEAPTVSRPDSDLRAAIDAAMSASPSTTPPTTQE